MHWSEEIPATIERVSQFTAVLEAILHDYGVLDGKLIALAVHELGANIVRHAYAGTPGAIGIDVTLAPGRLTIVCRDRAPNRYTPPACVRPPDPHDLPEGGWGLYLIYQIIDQVDYQPQPDGNEWRLVKRLPLRT